MKCLVVGGTGFLGGAMVDNLVKVGHDVSVLCRGGTKRRLPDGVSVIAADRFGRLSAVTDAGPFDWVFDSCAYTPDAVSRLLDAVGPSIARYVVISSISAYGSFGEPALDEDAAVETATADDYTVAAGLAPDQRANAAAYGPSYGRLKRAIELTAAERLGGRATAIRAGLLVGAGDYTNRLTWWVRRLDTATGPRQRVPAPGPRDRAVQMIDARDCAAFAVDCASRETGGIFNVTGPVMRLDAVLAEIVTATNSEPNLVWVDESRVIDAGVAPWTDMPLMAPTTPEFAHFMNVSTRRAEAAGLRLRPLQDTLRPLLAWDRDRRDLDLGLGLSPEQEAALLS